MPGQATPDQWGRYGNLPYLTRGGVCAMRELTYAEAIREALRQEMRRDGRRRTAPRLPSAPLGTGRAGLTAFRMTG